jgi:hypothetical protein
MPNVDSQLKENVIGQLYTHYANTKLQALPFAVSSLAVGQTSADPAADVENCQQKLASSARAMMSLQFAPQGLCAV